MGDSYSESSNVARDLIRLVFSFLDRPAYWLLGIAYQLFFNVASADIFSNNTIMKFYGRVQVILGVFMMFQLAMTILRGIMEPEGFTKEKGGGSLLKRVAISLIMITVLMPINIGSPRNEYEIQLNNNGLLFGTLYSLQHRILSNNTLGRLVLGTTESKTTFIEDDDTELKKSARIFTSTILKGFYRINLVPENKRVDSGGKDPATINKNRMCKDIDDSVLEAYTRVDAEPGEIIGMVNETCTTDFNPCNWLKITSAFCGSKKYVFTYMPVVSMIVAIIFVFILLSFSIDVAVRGIKLAILRLIAPIPIISYMDPKGSGDESFKSWTKILTTTYIDLFVRLAVVYFVIFIIQDMIINGFVVEHGEGLLGIVTMIIIWIGLFVFAKQAPKFIREVMGIKGDGGKLFSGMGAIVATAGMVGSAANDYRTAKKENEILHKDQKALNVFRNVGSAITGAISGGAAGYAAAGEKDASVKKVLQAQGQRNATRASHSTFMGRVGEDIAGVFTGRSLADTGNKVLENTQKAADLIKKLQDATMEEGLLNGAAIDKHADGSDIRIGGKKITGFDGKKWDTAWQDSQGKDFVTYDGIQIQKSAIEQLEVDKAKKSQVQTWMDPTKGGYKSGGKSYKQLTSDTEKLAAPVREIQTILVDADPSVSDKYVQTDLSSYGKAIGAAKVYVADTQGGKTESGMRQLRRNANKQNKGK